MLKKLLIEQFVIIDKLSLDLQSGLTVLTGETGAGKSILLDAVGLILGDEANPESVRQGAQQSVVEALLAPPASNPVWKLLAENNLTPASQQEFLIRRTIVHEGKGEILLGGKTLELDLLKKIGTYLGEIHGQFANQSLLDPANQRTLLDLSGAFPPEVFKNVADALHDVQRYTQALEEEKLFIARHGHELKKTEELVEKFDKIGIKKGFIEETKAEYARLLTAKETSEAFQSILAQLIAGNGALKALRSAKQILERQKNLDAAKMQKLTEYLTNAFDNAQAAVDEMERIAPEYDIDTGPVHEYEEKLKTLEDLSKETKIKSEDLFNHYEELSAKLKRIRGGQAKISELDDLLLKSKDLYLEHAHVLSEKREVAAKVMSDAITAELPPLKLLRAEFQVLVEEKPEIPWTEFGLDVVTFTARMNPGMPFSPIAETASGGELARMVLALKVVLQRVITIPTLIFDEVDTGIGGAAAAAVGERIAHLAEKTQVLVITHSPQVASRGDQHLYVSKKTDGVTTTSVVKTLSLDERIEEISRMLAGDQVTAESQAAAKSLIDEACAAKAQRQG